MTSPMRTEHTMTKTTNARTLWRTLGMLGGVSLLATTLAGCSSGSTTSTPTRTTAPAGQYAFWNVGGYVSTRLYYKRSQ